MKIESYFIESVDGNIMTGPAVFEEGIPRFTGDMSVFAGELPKGGTERGTVMVTDVKGMRKRNMDDAALRVKVPGNDMWFMTCIETEDDVLDGFLFNGEKLIIPYHTAKSDSLFETAYGISDSCIPAVFASGDTAITPKGREDMIKILDRLENIGFGSAVVAGSGIGKKLWEEIMGSFPDAIPYLEDPSLLPEEPALFITDRRF